MQDIILFILRLFEAVYWGVIELYEKFGGESDENQDDSLEV